MSAGMRRRYHQEAAAAIDADTECRVVEVDGEPVRVIGSKDWTEEDFAFFAEVIRAAKARAAGEA